MKKALVVGATGLIGGHLVQKLLSDNHYDTVEVLVRRSTGIVHAKLVEKIIDFDRLTPSDISADDVFCCLGTTIRKAGSQEAFRKVDFDYPLAVARVTKAANAKQFLIVTALGADAKSSVFYNRVKGEVETELQKIGFDGLKIMRPSLLLGDRSESRIGEQIGKVLAVIISPLLIGSLKKYAAIQGEQVASAMLKIAKAETKGLQIFESDQLAEL
jgi:uncharacterized protein YbjT (DUF2867 family)